MFPVEAPKHSIPPSFVVQLREVPQPPVPGFVEHVTRLLGAMQLTMKSRAKRLLRRECRILSSRREQVQAIHLKVDETGDIHQRGVEVSTGMIEYVLSL